MGRRVWRGDQSGHLHASRPGPRRISPTRRASFKEVLAKFLRLVAHAQPHLLQRRGSPIVQRLCSLLPNLKVVDHRHSPLVFRLVFDSSDWFLILSILSILTRVVPLIPSASTHTHTTREPCTPSMRILQAQQHRHHDMSNPPRPCASYDSSTSKGLQNMFWRRVAGTMWTVVVHGRRLRQKGIRPPCASHDSST